MRKIDELKAGCMARALDDEMTFVLLGRDMVAPEIVRKWAHARVRDGLNKDDDPQILEALECAETMTCERDSVRARKDSAPPALNAADRAPALTISCQKCKRVFMYRRIGGDAVEIYSECDCTKRAEPAHPDSVRLDALEKYIRAGHMSGRITQFTNGDATSTLRQCIDDDLLAAASTGESGGKE